jgi:hypothetical protein
MALQAFAAPALVGAFAILMSVYLALPVPVPGQAATALFFPGQQRKGLDALVKLDAEIRLLDSRADGLLISFEYRRTDLPRQLSGTGVIAVIGTGWVGCI